MSTRIKTVAFPLPNLSSIPSGTTTNFAQITVDLPESSKTFKSVWVDFGCNDIITETGGSINEWRLGAQLNESGYTTVTNINTIGSSGENFSPFISQDFTSLFTTNWTGLTTSMTFDLQVYLAQSTGSSGGFVSGSAILWITYEYNDSTTTTFVENAWIPMTSAIDALPSSKSSEQDTVPNLDSFLGYTGITYKHIMMIMEGNESNSNTTTNFAITIQLDATTEQVGNTHIASLSSDRYVREHFNLMSGGSPIFTTNETHNFYAWISTGSVTRVNHASFVILVVFTYGSDSPNGNRSLILPMNFVSPAGGTTNADYQKGSCELWIQEPATITTQKSAFRWYWDAQGPIANPYFRCGAQSFVTITDIALAFCGGNCYQRTCDDNIVLTRGRNVLTSDVYRADTVDKMWALCGIWFINYKCGRPSGGWPVANHTILYSLSQYGTNVTTLEVDVSATSIPIPETLYFISSLGVWVNNILSSANALYSYNVVVEKLLAEGGVQWKSAYSDFSHTDTENGHRQIYSKMTDLFKRFPGDANHDKIDIEINRRWRLYTIVGAGWWSFIILMTYHSISYTVSGTISGSGGGTVNLYLYMNDTDTIMPGELLLTGSTVSDSSYSFTWYDNTINVYVNAIEDSTHLGRSENDLAT